MLHLVITTERYTVKALLTPGGLFNFRGPRGGLIGVGGLLEWGVLISKIKIKDFYDFEQ